MAKEDSLENATGEDKELAELMRGMLKNPKTRRAALQTIKAHSPDTPIPELEVEARMQAYAKPAMDELAKMKADRIKEQVEGRIEKSRTELKEQGFAKEDIEAIEKLMTEKQIPSHATAAEHYSMSKKLAQPAPASLRTMTNTLPIDRKLVEEAGGIKNWARNEAMKAADDIKSGRIKLH